MGLDFFRRSIELQRQYARPGQSILNTLQTNGTLLNDEWAEFLKANDFFVGISVAQAKARLADRGALPDPGIDLPRQRVPRDEMGTGPRPLAS